MPQPLPGCLGPDGKWQTEVRNWRCQGAGGGGDARPLGPVRPPAKSISRAQTVHLASSGMKELLSDRPLAVTSSRGDGSYLSPSSPINRSHQQVYRAPYPSKTGMIRRRDVRLRRGHRAKNSHNSGAKSNHWGRADTTAAGVESGSRSTSCAGMKHTIMPKVAYPAWRNVSAEPHLSYLASPTRTPVRAATLV